MAETLLLIVLILMPFGDIAATAFFYHLFRHSKSSVPPPAEETLSQSRKLRFRGATISMLGGRSWLLGLMTLAWATITLVYLLIGFLAARRIVGLEPFPLGAVLTAIGTVVLGTIPIVFAVAFYLTRRRHGAPPPFGDRD